MCLYTFPCLLKIGPLVSKGILESVVLTRPQEYVAAAEGSTEHNCYVFWIKDAL